MSFSKYTPEEEQVSMIYTARRQFLVPPNKNNLEPPTLFKTKQQAKKKAIGELLSQRTDQNGEIRFKMDIAERKAPTAPRVRTPAVHNRNRKEDDTIVIEKYSSTSRNDWKERNKAGCRIWINRNTGELRI